MTTRQLTGSAMSATMGERLLGFSDYLRQFPVSFWRYIVLLLAAIWICFSLAGLFWLVMPSPKEAQPPVFAKLPAVQPSGATSSVQINVATLQAMHLFGDASNVQVEPAASVAQSDIPDDIANTRLNLKLQGVVASSNPDDARAIIADGNLQALYSIGENLAQKGVKLAKVFAARVILDNNGRYESLWLYSENDYPKTSTNNPAARRAPNANGAARNRNVSSAQAPERTINATARRDQVPKSINDVVRFSVHREGGKMVGYRVRPGRNRELFEQVGLQNNDIVTAVNGVNIDDPKQIRNVYQSLRTATEAQLEVLREGATYTINISLDTGG